MFELFAVKSELNWILRAVAFPQENFVVVVCDKRRETKVDYDAVGYDPWNMTNMQQLSGVLIGCIRQGMG